MAKIAVQPIGAGNSGLEWTLIGREEFSFSGAENTTKYSTGFSVPSETYNDNFFLLIHFIGTAMATKTVSGYNYDKAGVTNIKVVYVGESGHAAVGGIDTIEACATDTVGTVATVDKNYKVLYVKSSPSEFIGRYESYVAPSGKTYKVKFMTSAYGTGVASGTLEVFAGKFKFEGKTL